MAILITRLSKRDILRERNELLKSVNAKRIEDLRDKEKTWALSVDEQAVLRRWDDLEFLLSAYAA